MDTLVEAKQQEASECLRRAARLLGLSDKETKRWSLFKAIRALEFGRQNYQYLKDAAFEIECSRAVAGFAHRL